ncbi:MAG: hypothetical protein ACO1N3_01435 [Gammaproteobacteria bacterium]
MINQHYYSFMLSQILGAFLFIVAIIIMGRMYYYRKIILNLQAQDPIIPVVASITLFLGIVLVVTHNVWELHRATAITILCWVILIKGLLWLALPENMLAIAKKIMAGTGYYWLIVGLVITGVVFLGKGMELFILNRSALVTP